MTAEEQRLMEASDRTAHWKRWGPYLSERAWGTVREDYSAYGTAWDYLPHDHARSKAYRWNEDGIGGVSDRQQLVCFAVALWNEHDPILKERLFGLAGPEGNHGEDVKEYYFYLDSTPTHSYMKHLSKYPQDEFPYGDLVNENRRRGRDAPEYELMDTGVFDDNRYFDVLVEYAKAEAEDILVRIQVTNRASQHAHLQLLPTIWFRNRWSWGYGNPRPVISRKMAPVDEAADDATIELDHFYYGRRFLYCEGAPSLLFTENETNNQRLFQVGNDSKHVKDGINDYVVQGARDAVNPEQTGTKAAALYRLNLNGGETATVRLRFTNVEDTTNGANVFGADFDQVFALRQSEADEFYATVIPQDLSADAQSVMRQSFAGLLWSKQYYHYVV